MSTTAKKKDWRIKSLSSKWPQMTTELTVSKLYHPGPIVESLVKMTILLH